MNSGSQDGPECYNIMLENVNMISFLRKLNIGTRKNVIYKCNEIEKFRVKNFFKVRKEKP